MIGIHCSSLFADIKTVPLYAGPKPPAYGTYRLDMIGKVLVPGAIDPFRYEADIRGGGVIAEGEFPKVHLERLIDHVDYLVNLAGIDHVGVGTDFQFLEDAVIDFDAADKTPNVTATLLARGYAPDAVHKIMGGNFLRVMEAVLGA